MGLTGPTDPALRALHRTVTLTGDEYEAMVAALAAAEAAPLDVERRILERLDAIVAYRYNLGPIFQPDVVDREQAKEVVRKQFAREYAALRSPDTETER